MTELELANRAIECVSQATSIISRGNAILERVVAELISTRHELLAYRFGALEPNAQVAEIERLSGLPDDRTSSAK